MPPSEKFSKEDILRAAMQIVEQDGCEELNARRLAGALHCSVQPIYRHFETMDALRNAVAEQAYSLYKTQMCGGAEQNGYRGMGLAYIRFARDYPNCFKLLFMRESGLRPERFIEQDDVGNQVLSQGQQFSGLTSEQQRTFHMKVWLFTHGIASVVAMKTVTFTDGEIETMLTDTVRQMLIGYRIELEKGEQTQ